MKAALLSADPAGIAAAAAALKAGRLVAFPTETVYGLGADATNDSAVAAIFAAKNRPSFNPLIIHVGDLATAEGLALFDERAALLARRFWPGPLTIVLPRKSACTISLLASAGLDTLAVRLPRHPVAAALLKAFGGPIAAPSANISGRLSATTAEHVAQSLGGALTAIIEGGATDIGLESTIVELTGADARLLRPGGLPTEAIEAVIGPLVPADEAAGIRAPGMLASHYAPERSLRLDVAGVRADEALLAFGPNPPTGAKTTLNLSAAGDLDEAAANLFAFLRRLDDSVPAAIAVMPIPEKGLGRAINDRLRRAAAPRSTT